MREFRLRRIHLLAFVGRVAWSSGKCINNIEDIYEAENQVQDIGFERTYVLCPRSIYDIGYLDVNFGVTGFKKSPPLPIRPNMRILCGDSGNRDELCWIADGDVQMDATNIRGITDESVENVLIQGFTFIGAKKHALWASKPGNITFRDCEFRVSWLVFFGFMRTFFGCLLFSPFLNMHA